MNSPHALTPKNYPSAGLDLAVHVFGPVRAGDKDVGGRVKPGHGVCTGIT